MLSPLGFRFGGAAPCGHKQHHKGKWCKSRTTAGYSGPENLGPRSTGTATMTVFAEETPSR
jgi:hypothetical protein